MGAGGIGDEGSGSREGGKKVHEFRVGDGSRGRLACTWRSAWDRPMVRV